MERNNKECDCIHNQHEKDSILNSLNNNVSLIENSPKHRNWKNQVGLSYSLKYVNSNEIQNDSIEIIVKDDSIEIKYQFKLVGTETVFPFYEIQNDTANIKYFELTYAEIQCNNEKPEIQWLAMTIESQQELTIKLNKIQFANKYVKFRNKCVKIEK